MKKMSRGTVATLAAALALTFWVLPAAGQDAGEPTIPEFGVGSEVVDHELAGKADRFEEGQQVVFWTRVVGGAEGQRIRHVWMRDGEEVVSIGLALGGAHWRTYSRKTLHPGSVGSWTVEARDDGDRVLARSEFECVSAGAASAGSAGDS